MALRRYHRRPAESVYSEEPSLSTKMAWAICDAVYQTTPEQSNGGVTTRCNCMQRGGNVACDVMLRAVSNASKVAIDHANSKK